MVKCVNTLQTHYLWYQVIFSYTSNGSLNNERDENGCGSLLYLNNSYWDMGIRVKHWHQESQEIPNNHSDITNTCFTYLPVFTINVSVF